MFGLMLNLRRAGLNRCDFRAHAAQFAPIGTVADASVAFSGKLLAAAMPRVIPTALQSE